MLIDLIKLWLICLFLFESGGEHKELNWLRNFINYIETNAEVHQVVFLVEENLHPGSETTFRRVSENFPTRTIDLKDAEIRNARRLIQSPSFLNPQTSLFITIQSRVDNQSQLLGKARDLLTEISQNRKRPKYLIMSFREEGNHTYEKLLRQLWSKQFLDATILEILKQRAGKNDFLLERHEERARIFYFNPFTESFTSRKTSEGVCFFPDKLIDMHGYELKISFINRPPEAIINHNESTHNVSGLMFLKIKALSKAMKFSINIPGNITSYGKYSCSKNGSTQMSHSLRNNEIHLSGMEYGRYDSCENTLFEWSAGIGNPDICLVVPVLENETHQLTISWKVLNGIVVLSMPLILWITSRLLGFEKQSWRLEYMVEIVFGFTVPREPRNQAERFFFAAILWAYFLHSSVIYTALTSINVSREDTIKFGNIDEVVSSDLEILMSPLYYSLVYSSSNGSVRNLLDKATKTNLTAQQCLDRLIKYKDVGCILKQDEAEMILREERKSCGQPVAKIMDEFVVKSISNTVFEPGSPFVKKIDDLIQRLYEVGSVRKWWNEYNFKKSSNTLHTSISCTPQKSEMALMIRHIIVLLIFGYVCSIIVFIFELMIPLLKKKLRRRRGE